MCLPSRSATPRCLDRVFVVLLKSGFIYVEECEKGQEFSTAETASAGILGVFENIEEARAMTCDGLPPGVAGQTVSKISGS